MKDSETRLEPQSLPRYCVLSTIAEVLILTLCKLTTFLWELETRRLNVLNYSLYTLNR